MKSKNIYKSEEGRKKILAHYKKFIDEIGIPVKKRYVETSYGKTFFIEAGNTDKPKVFLFHGSCSNSAMWFGDLKSLVKDFHVFAVDIIGEPGNSCETRLNTSTNEYAYWIKEIFDELNIEEATLVGNSFGGWMSLKFATTFPERVSSMVLIATSGVTGVKISFVLKSIIYTLQGEKGLKKLNYMVYGTTDIPKEVLEFGNLIMNNFNPMLGGLPTYKDEELKKLNMPVMYIAGENDVTVNVEKTVKRLKRNVEKSTVRVIKNTGHVIYNIMDEIKPFIENKL